MHVPRARLGHGQGGDRGVRYEPGWRGPRDGGSSRRWHETACKGVYHHRQGHLPRPLIPCLQARARQARLIRTCLVALDHFPGGLAEDDIRGFTVLQDEVVEQRRFFDLVWRRRRGGQCKTRDMLKRSAVTNLSLPGLWFDRESGCIRVHRS